ncbi:MAG: hypothetical protein QG597_182 [Actinomycetota bacterium]|nr:hypothetical protein [Actinomycetota bacterium]
MGKTVAAIAGTVLVLLVVLVAVISGGVSDSPTPGASRDLRAGTVPAVYHPALVAAGTRCPEAPAPVLAAQIEAESGWNPRAVSQVGAQGLSQFLPGTWARYGVDANGDGRRDPWDPLDAIASQAAYDCALAQELRPAIATGQIRGNVTELMLAAYNAGPQAVLRHGGVPPYDETTAYVQKIMTRSVFYATTPALTAQPGQGDGLGPRIVAAATTQLGIPYSWGGGSPTGPTGGTAHGAGTLGFDCSGLVVYAVAQASGGRTVLPHFADTQTRTGTPITDPAQLQPGDLISFTRPGESVAHHIGIYAGAGRMIHAPQTGSVVSVESLSTPHWKGQSWRAVRLG